MNALIVGTDKSGILDFLPDTFLYIDDHIDVPVPKRRKVTVLDLEHHHFNPLKDMSYKRARDFLSVINAIFPEGDSTLTRKSSNYELLKALTDNPKRLDKLIHPIKDNPGTLDAYQKIQTLLLSPVLKAFFRPTNFPLDGIILAQLDRTVLAEFDCFVIANLLISAYQGPVVIPDFGFYSCAFHTQLIRQDRLIAGVNFLDEPDDLKLRKRLLSIRQKFGRHCSAEDAETLAGYCSGFPKGTGGYSTYIEEAMA